MADNNNDGEDEVTIPNKRVVVINPDDSRKCELCSKTVYRAEEIKAVDGVWHIECFVCGGNSDHGCKKKLKLGNFKCADKIPYCNVCGDRYVNDTKLVGHNVNTNTDEADIIPAKNPYAYAPGESDFQSYELPDSFGKPAKSTAADKFRRLQEKTECPTCSKQVYKAEELVALGSTWHKSCFTCGGSSDLGCKRKLALGAFRVHEKLPFCDPCITRISRENNSKPVSVTEQPMRQDVSTGDEDPSQNGESIISPGPDASNQNQKFYDYDYSNISGIGEKSKSSATDKLRSAGNKTTCPQCNKSVYKAEELVALGSTWHQSCFTCGGSTDQGCKRRLALGTFQVHNGTQFCSACCDRIGKDSYSKPVVSTTAGMSNDTTETTIQAPTNPVDISDYNYDYSAGFGKKPSSVNKFANMNTNKCPACSKTVYKAEELVALNASWHSACFTCGGSNDNGCKRRLALGGFQVMQGVQYCFPCADKLGKEAYMKAPGSVSANRPSTVDAQDSSGVPGAFSPAGQSTSIDASNYNYELSSDFGKSKPSSVNKFANMNANKCPACSKTVYKAEELVALNASWHSTCFTCGGSSEGGCKRRLALGSFQLVNGVQYCFPCADKAGKDAYSRSISKSDLSAPRSDASLSEEEVEASSRTNSQDNQTFISYEMNDSGGNNYKASKANRVASERFSRLNAENSLKCPACSATVFSAEQLIALNASWHPACFTCGGNGDLGCKRRLALGSYRAISKVPYCENCFGKVSKLEIAKTTVVVATEPSPHVSFGLMSPPITQIDESGTEEISSNASSPRNRIAELSQTFRKQSVESTDISSVSLNSEESAYKRASTRLKFQPVVNDANRCPVCAKEVYKHGQLLALGSPWHPSCFLCGGKGDAGCRKKLTLGEFSGDGGNPYCKICGDKLRTEANSKSVAAASVARDSSEVPSFTSPKYNSTQSATLSAPTEDPNNMSYELPLSVKKPVNEKFKFLGGGDSSKKCQVCTKTVYATEEIVLGSSVYHSTCFTCGGKGDSGCKRKIGNAGDGQLFQGSPYCNFCFDRVVKSSIAMNENLGEKATVAPKVEVSAYDYTGYTTAPTVEPSTSMSSSEYTSAATVVVDEEVHVAAALESTSITDAPTVEPTATVESTTEPTAEPTAESTATVESTTEPMVESTVEPVTVSESTSEPTAEPTAESTATSESTTEPMVESTVEPVTVSESNVEHAHEPIVESAEIASPAVATISAVSTEVPMETTTEEFVPVVTETVNSRTNANINNQKAGYVEYITKGVTYRGVRTEYQHDFDENGVIFYIGSEGKTKEFSNPHNAALVKARMSSTFKGEASNLVSRENSTAPTYTGNDPDSFVEVDLGAEHRLLIDKYTVLHGAAAKGNALRNWMLMAKVDKQSPWVLLRDHGDDTQLAIQPKSTASWNVDFNPPDDLNHDNALGFRIFRITQTGPNSSGNDCLFCCGIELYGMLFKRV